MVGETLIVVVMETPYIYVELGPFSRRTFISVHVLLPGNICIRMYLCSKDVTGNTEKSLVYLNAWDLTANGISNGYCCHSSHMPSRSPYPGSWILIPSCLKFE